jgi:hypothetical protein
MNLHGLHFDRPYEAILFWLKGHIHGKSIDAGVLRFPSGGSLEIRGYDLIAEGLNQHELYAVQRLMLQQNSNTTKFHAFNNLTARLKVPITEAPKNSYRLERLKLN